MNSLQKTPKDALTARYTVAKITNVRPSLSRRMRLVACLALLFIGGLVHAQTTNSTDFVTTWTTSTANETLVFPGSPATDDGGNVTGSYTIDWGDESATETVTAKSISHTYATPNTYTVRASNTITAFTLATRDAEGFLNPSASAPKLTTIQQWGTAQWTTMENAFGGATQLTYATTTDAPNLSNVTSMHSMFSDAAAFNGNIEDWNVSNVTSMRGMFYDAAAFNQDIGDWNVTNVTDMGFMFRGAADFNQDIGGWNVANVTDMSFMFVRAAAFNQDIGGWNVANVTNMRSMFYDAAAFNQDIGGWNVANVTNMLAMFEGVTAFNQDIGRWNVTNVTNMSFMFNGAAAFNQDIGGWNVANVTDMSFMFNSAAAFNQDIGGWNVANVTNMLAMFGGATAFNQDIGRWNVAKVTDMSDMFGDADVFNGDISNWNVANVTNMDSVFYQATAFNQDIGGWNVANVTNMRRMFFDAAAFNQDIGGWNVAKVTDMSDMFGDADVFNGDISNWNVANVTNMDSVFYQATAFNQDIGGWNVSNVTSMSDMFEGATAFMQNLGAWYITPGSFIVMDEVTAGGTVGEIIAQNTVLTGHNPTYVLGGTDASAFNVTNRRLTLSGLPTKSSYTITITSTGAFGTNNSRDLTIMIPSINTAVPLGNEDFELREFTISPNPTTDILTITIVEKADYQLLNIRGQMLKKGNLATGEENRLDISSLPKGIYFLNLKTSKGSFTEKVVRR